MLRERAYHPHPAVPNGPTLSLDNQATYGYPFPDTGNRALKDHHNVFDVWDGRLAQTQNTKAAAATFNRNQQYAHPADSSSSDGRAAENMLRRKTPNGTFNAAYDGSSSEWSQSRQPAKHLLMPVSKFSTSVPNASQYGKRMTHHQASQQPLATTTRTPSRHDRASMADLSQLGRQVPGSRNKVPLDSTDTPFTGVDSMLGHHGYHRQVHNVPANFTVPTVLQPLWPPSSGPTSLQTPLPLGPYWPDGVFEPYRPTPLCQTTYKGVPPAPNGDIHTYPYQTAVAEGQQQLGPGCLPTGHLPNLPSEYIARQQAVHNSLRPIDNVYTSSLPRDFHAKLALSKDQDSTNTTVSQRPGETSTSKSPPISSPTHFKERILIWAHRIYCNLLATIEISRREHSVNQSPDKTLSLQRPRRPYPSWTNKKARHISPNVVKVSGALGDEVDHRIAHSPAPQLSASNTSACWGLSNVDLASTRASLNSTECTDPDRGWAPTAFQQHGRASHSGPFSSYIPPRFDPALDAQSPLTAALKATEILDRLCEESKWQWIDGMLLNGCLAYGLGNYAKATKWYLKVLRRDPQNAEAMSNLAATFLSQGHRQEAERYWMQVVKQRPWYFEAVEHLVGLLHEENRAKETINVIKLVERALRRNQGEASDCGHIPHPPPTLSSEFAIPSSDHGRLLALIHGKGNVLYQSGDNDGAAKAFEDAILLGTGQFKGRIRGLVIHLTHVFSEPKRDHHPSATGKSQLPEQPVLLPPEAALETARLAFPPHGNLPGLEDVPSGMAQKAAVSIISNSLLSLAKIYQDCMSSNGVSAAMSRATCGVQEILSLYYLSLSLQPSPSTANNVGILLAGVQQPARIKQRGASAPATRLAGLHGVVPGSGVALALAYYDYGLKLDARHAHLYTNLGSLFKDMGQLSPAIKMYEKAVDCDSNFDIALANLANAVKDRGNIRDAIEYYKRAVKANPDFAEAVCGLANALNSVCSWHGRGGISSACSEIDRWHVDEHGLLYDPSSSNAPSSGWMDRVINIVRKQLAEGRLWGKGILSPDCITSLGYYLNRAGLPLGSARVDQTLSGWAGVSWEGAKIVRLIERVTKVLTWSIYHERTTPRSDRLTVDRKRPQLPPGLTIPNAPTVLPFHTFTCPLSAKEIRLISQRNGLRVSCTTLKAPWLPQHIYEPPHPPDPQLNVGYISSDFNNHPLAHLMQSVFGFHDTSKVRAICYATTASDGSTHRRQIERESPMFFDCSGWSIEQIVNQVIDDQVHILVNLNGYTRGAKNEVFAARPAPIQMSFMGFAGTLGAEWCDYLLADRTTIPPSTLRPIRANVSVSNQLADGTFDDEDSENWVYGENIIFTRDSFFCCDHRQSASNTFGRHLAWEEEQKRRWRMRKEVFPSLADDCVILGNFNQLYKIEPTTFRSWLRILSRVPKAVLWLLRFPELGEHHLRATALQWVGAEVASRLVFTDVAPKQQHIARATICDLFVDTPECNAHTTAADVLWSGTPLLTYSRYDYKMCSRIAASILRSALPKNAEGDRATKDLIAVSDETYEEQGVELASDLVYPSFGDEVGCGRGRLMELRKLLYHSRWTSALFDTRRWVSDLEDAYQEAWRRWVAGVGGDIWL